MPALRLSSLTIGISNLAICLTLFFSAPQLRAAETNTLRVGAAKIDITPKDLTGLVSVWNKPFDGVHDPIFARALLLDNGTNTAAIVATDLVEFGRTLALRQRIARELAIPVDHIMITASHDHNAPRGGPITPGTSSEQGRPSSTPAYTQFVDDRIVEALKKARSSLQPARVGVGAGYADINVNRNRYNGKGYGGADVDGPSDKTVWVVKFENLSGEPIALLMNYAVHSVVAGPQNALVTGDLAGATERFVEKQLQDKVVALFTMGAAGDQNPKFSTSLWTMGSAGEQGKKDPAMSAPAYEAMDTLGAILGAEVIQTANRIARMTPNARIEAEERVFSCATPPPTTPAGAASTNAMPAAPKPATMDIRLGLIKINQIALTGVSGEVFTKIYWRLRKESPLTNTIMATIANDRIGYIADDAEYGGPYSRPDLARGCAEDGIVNGLVDMISAHP
jgi:Neutral/alkaline non-lysosomal ceramidase, N-terminal